MFIKQLQTGCLAHFAYYIESEGEAAIIDPLRETAPYLELAQERGAKIKYVLETHFHADFVSGHLDLARESGATLVFGERAEPHYEAHLAKDYKVLPLGKISFQVLPTPGHTVESVSYLLVDENGKKHALFTGDALFVGDVGRPDLSSGDLSQEALASLLYDTIQHQFKTLPDEVLVYPAHGQGSACGKNLGPETFSTIGEQKKSNYALQDMTREAFIKEVTDGLEQPPAYFFKDAAINMKGYDDIEQVLEKNIQPLSLSAFDEVLAQGAIVLDTRTSTRFEAGSVPGAWNISLRGNYAPWVGALVPFGSRLVLITEPGEEAEAVLRLARVGYENVAGYLEGGFEAWEKDGRPVERVESVCASTLPQLLEDLHPTVLDVRTMNEYGKGHLEGAKNIPLDLLPKHFDELPKDKPYLIHCAGGYRSMVATSMMKAQGFEKVVNLQDGYNGLVGNGSSCTLQSA